MIGTGTESSEKVLAERGTGLYTGDIWMGGLTTMSSRLIPKGVLDPVAPYLVLPEVTDKSLWWRNHHHYGDLDQQRIFLFAASPNAMLSYNTTMVEPDQITSWMDLLNPKWKGKIVARDVTAAGTGSALANFYFHPQLGPELGTSAIYGAGSRHHKGRGVRAPSGWLWANTRSISSSPATIPASSRTRGCLWKRSLRRSRKVPSWPTGAGHRHDRDFQ